METSNLKIDKKVKERLTELGKALINQKKARVIVEPMERSEGFWFGGGNIVEDKSGNFYISGRYRNAGDSRYGLGRGTRGLELAVFKSEDRGKSFKKVESFSKKDLSYGGKEVISIEGSWLDIRGGNSGNGVDFYISTEKGGIDYPEGLKEFKKPGTGVWSVDVIQGESVEDLMTESIRLFLNSNNSNFLHIKDPFGFKRENGDTVVGFCTHPFCWTSSNTGYAVRDGKTGGIKEVNFTFFPRGYTWDVAMTRVTDFLKVPAAGMLKDLPQIYLIFYDGGESVRKYEEHKNAVKRPRGYSCEEIGGLAFSTEEEFPVVERLSVNLPIFTSPYGTGASRYVSTLVAEEGIYATWEQSQEDFSQPLVMNFLSKEETEDILK